MTHGPPPSGYGGPAPGQPPSPGWYPPVAPGPPARPPKRPPKKAWYVLAALLLALGVAGVGVGIALLVSSHQAQPSAEHQFSSGGSTTVHFDAGETKVIFGESNAQRHHVHCEVTGASDGIRIQQFSGSLTIDQWDAAFTVHAPSSGDQTINCTGDRGDTFGVGGDASLGTFFGGLLGVIAGAGALLLGVVTLAITAVLRRRRG